MGIIVFWGAMLGSPQFWETTIWSLGLRKPNNRFGDECPTALCDGTLL